MRVHIRCFYADGSEILGNGDGQMIVDCAVDYRRTLAYTRLKHIVGNPAYKNGRVASCRIYDDRTGKLLEEYQYTGNNNGNATHIRPGQAR